MRIKTHLLLILIVPLSINLFSQEFNGGFSAGLSTSEISGDFLEGPNKAGVYLGVFTNLYISPKSSLQLELNFVQKGSRKNPDSLDLTTYLLRLNYFEMPLLYKWDFMKRLTLEAGPSIGILLTHFEEADGEILEDPPFKSLDFGLSLGLYYRLTENIDFNIRYFNTVFFPVREHGSGATYWLNRGQYNEVLSFTFQFTLFNLGDE